MADNIIFRLSPAGGPPPEAEILFHAQRAQEYGHTWVGLRRPQNADRICAGESRLYLITSEARRQKTVLRGIVREVTSTRPDDELLGDLYTGHTFPAWWRIDAVECVTMSDFDALGLRKTDGTPYDTAWLSIRQPFNYLQQVSAWPADAADASDAVEITDDFVAPPLIPEEPVFPALHLPASHSTVSETSIHAVDWSGGGDFGTRNAKIRYARWDIAATGSTVTVLPPTLSRSEILRMVQGTPGLWMLDFPFGLPAELLRRAGVRPNDFHSALAFTRGIPKNEFRDRCNTAWATGQSVSKHRATERAVGCGWFDWFIQLFRQTWTGQVEILSAIRDHAAILPWDHDRVTTIQLVEGFPGASLRHRRLPAEGYKHATARARAIREEIVAGLVTHGLPLTDAIRAEAIADTTGDLIDALVMLLAGRDALSTDHAAIQAELHRQGLLGEGWIYR